MGLEPVSEIDEFIQRALQREQAGDMAGALRLARQAQETARNGHPPLEYARALTAVGRYRFRLGQYETARKLAGEALELTDPTIEPQAVVHTEALLLLGMVALETNSMTECESRYRAAVDLAREIGHPLLFQRALHNLGSAVYLFGGQFALAIEADTQSLQICRSQGYADWAIFPLITLAIAYQITGQRLKAKETVSELRRNALSDSAGEGYACYVSGMLALDEEDFPTGESELNRARSLAEAIGDPSLNLDSRLGLSRMCRLKGDGSKALTWSQDALAFAGRVGYRIYQGRARLELARAAWLLEDLLTTEKELEQAGEIFTEMGLNYDLAELGLLRVTLYHQCKDARAAALLPSVSSAIQAGGYGFLLERERALVYPLADYLNYPEPQVGAAAAKLLEGVQGVPPRPLRVETLGGFSLWVGARLVDGRTLRQRRAGELLALLLSSRGYTLSAGQVTEALCPEKDPEAAAHFYHHAISALRRVLEPDLPNRRFACRYLEVSDEQVTLILPTGSRLDFMEFELVVQAKEWEKAIGIYKGEYLAIFGYQEWTIALRQHFADLFEQALIALAVERLEEGAAADCLGLARQALLHNPWQEAAVELGMHAALALGDRTTAIQLYNRLEKTLEKDLGLAPLKELQQLVGEARKMARGK